MAVEFLQQVAPRDTIFASSERSVEIVDLNERRHIRKIQAEMEGIIAERRSYIDSTYATIRSGGAIISYVEFHDPTGEGWEWIPDKDGGIGILNGDRDHPMIGIQLLEVADTVVSMNRYLKGELPDRGIIIDGWSGGKETVEEMRLRVRPDGLWVTYPSLPRQEGEKPIFSQREGH